MPLARRYSGEATPILIATTGLFCLVVLPGAVLDIGQPEMIVEVMTKLGLPGYLLTLMGVWKFLGVTALAAPRSRRINELAYAGFFFDFTGAAFCHAAVGDTAGVPVPLVFLVLLAASYFLRPEVSDAASMRGG